MKTLMLALAALLVAGIGYASAAPIAPKALADNDAVVLAACNPGTKNCVTMPGGRPSFCNPCTIDGGLGSECQGGAGTICGNANQTLGTQVGGSSSGAHGGSGPGGSAAASGLGANVAHPPIQVK